MDQHNPKYVKELAESLLRIMTYEQKCELKLLVESSIQILDPKNDVVTFPTSIFSSNLSSLETIILFLIDYRHVPTKIIAQITQRKLSTIYATYYAAKKKFAGNLSIETSAIEVPLSVIANRKYSVLEALTSYLHDVRGMNISETAKVLHRTQNTVKTVYNRYKKKNATQKFQE